MGVRIAHVSVRAKDGPASVRFYRALGFEICSCLQYSPTEYFLQMSVKGQPNVTIEIQVNESPAPEYDRSPGTGHFALNVTDLAATAQRLAELGLTPDSPRHPGGREDAYICFVFDPDGNKIELNDDAYPLPQDPLPAAIAAIA